MREAFLRSAAGAACALATAAAAAAEAPATEAWRDVLDLEFAGAEVVYDDSIHLVAPERVEEAFSVPVVIGFAETPYSVREVALFAENNPFPQVMRAVPNAPLHAIGLDIRLERSTPVRAAVRDEAGVWHVASREVRVANPGGCSAGGGGGMPVGEIAMRQFVRPNGVSRLKLRIGHPMHTGLAVDAATDEVVPAHYIDRVAVGGAAGALVELRLWASVSADPTLMFDLPEAQASVRVEAADTEAGIFDLAARPPTIRRGYRWEDEFAVDTRPVDAM